MSRLGLGPDICQLKMPYPPSLQRGLRKYLLFWAPLDGSTAAYGRGSTTPTYSRATNGWYVHPSTGLVALAASGAPRFESNGMLFEAARTNICIQSDDLTNVAWIAVNMTAAKTATGADGVTNSATTLTATAGNATILQAIVNASSTKTASCYIKRRTGTGTVNLTQDNGATWTAVTVTSGWTQVQVPSATVVNPIVGLRIVTSGDAVDVQYFQVEEATFASSPIPTTAAAVTRNAESLTYPAARNVPALATGVTSRSGTIYAEVDSYAVTTAQTFVDTRDGSLRGGVVFGINATSDPTSDVFTASSEAALAPTTTDFVASTRKRICMAWDLNDVELFVDGFPRGSDTSAAFPTSHTRIGIGLNGNDLIPLYGHVRNVMIFGARLSQAEMAQLR